MWKFLWYFYCNFLKIPEELADVFEPCPLVSLLPCKASEKKHKLRSRGVHLQQWSPGGHTSFPSGVCNHIASLRKSKNISFVADEVIPKLA